MVGVMYSGRRFSYAGVKARFFKVLWDSDKRKLLESNYGIYTIPIICNLYIAYIRNKRPVDLIGYYFSIMIFNLLLLKWYSATNKFQ